MPACSLRIIFSPSAAFSVTFARSNVASERSPFFALSLWQPVQYAPTSAPGSDGARAADVFCPAGAAGVAAVAAGGFEGACPGPATIVRAAIVTQSTPADTQ